MAFEINFDGLIGPTHNYAGLSFGNVASEQHRHQVSHPRNAALQGLEKMRNVAALGVPQFFLPPVSRPNFSVLRQLGFSGSEAEMIRNCATANVSLLASVYSAASMWTANAATVTPSIDAADGRLHLTPANLSRTFHRSFDHTTVRDVLRDVLTGSQFTIHDALPAAYAMSDEGAANHTRLCATHADPGLHLLVYGFDPFARSKETPQKFPARQSRLASESIARRHGIKDSILIQQTARAIDAGVFHNDVISVGNENVLLLHEHAFVDQSQVLAKIESFFEKQKTEFHAEVFSEAELPMSASIASYFFNSQIITRPDGNMTLICPQEVSENEYARKSAERLVAGSSRIDQVKYFDLRQSMNNGGGPACLRLRVAVTQVELQNVNSAFEITEPKAERLGNWITRHYRETLALEDLADPALATESATALAELADAIGAKN